jgi:hypothetical protein
MSFLLDSDTCSAYLRQPGPLFARSMQYGGRLWISTITLSDLYTWAYKRPQGRGVKKWLSHLPSPKLADANAGRSLMAAARLSTGPLNC